MFIFPSFFFTCVPFHSQHHERYFHFHERLLNMCRTFHLYSSYLTLPDFCLFYAHRFLAMKEFYSWPVKYLLENIFPIFLSNESLLCSPVVGNKNAGVKMKWNFKYLAHDKEDKWKKCEPEKRFWRGKKVCGVYFHFHFHSFLFNRMGLLF